VQPTFASANDNDIDIDDDSIIDVDASILLEQGCCVVCAERTASPSVGPSTVPTTTNPANVPSIISSTAPTAVAPTLSFPRRLMSCGDSIHSPDIDAPLSAPSPAPIISTVAPATASPAPSFDREAKNQQIAVISVIAESVGLQGNNNNNNNDTTCTTLKTRGFRVFKYIL